MVFARGQVVVLGSSEQPVLAPGATATWVHAGVVLEDSPDLVAVCHLPGSGVLVPSGPRRGPRERLLLTGDVDGPPSTTTWWGDAVVKVHRWGEPWSVWRWLGRGGWSRDRYVNLEQPWVRTPAGFHTDDWTLDLVVVPSAGGWSVRTKDADELAWLHEVGALTADDVAEVEAAGDRARTAARAGAWPFGADWDRWLPDPAWPPPQLTPA